MQRFITSIVLLSLLVVLICVGGALVAVTAVAAVCIGLWQEYGALRHAGVKPVAWPAWVTAFVGGALTYIYGANAIMPVVLAAAFVMIATVIFRKSPQIEDILYSLLPMAHVVLPGMAVVAMSTIEQKYVQVVLYVLIFAVPILCDIFAFFVGSKVRGPKLCPVVSPNKTISGAIGGMIGAVLGALLTGFAAVLILPPETVAKLPSLWQFLLIGMLGGIVSQLGDLFASLVKRHCGLKDYSSLFPGHGGMMDRLDSILFMVMLIFCFRGI